MKSRRPSRSIRSDDLPDGIGGIVPSWYSKDVDAHEMVSERHCVAADRSESVGDVRDG